MSEQITVALVDDQDLIRSGIAMVVDSQPDMTVATQASNGQQAVETSGVVNPDVVLMDVRMPVLDGIGTTQALIAANPEAKIIVLTTFDVDEYALKAIDARASEFLLKDAPPENRLDAIRVVYHGDAVIAPSITRAASAVAGGGNTHPRERVQAVVTAFRTGVVNAEDSHGADG